MYKHTAGRGTVTKYNHYQDAVVDEFFHYRRRDVHVDVVGEIIWLSRPWRERGIEGPAVNQVMRSGFETFASREPVVYVITWIC